jgi:hypothetical protein
LRRAMNSSINSTNNCRTTTFGSCSLRTSFKYEYAWSLSLSDAWTMISNCLGIRGDLKLVSKQERCTVSCPILLLLWDLWSTDLCARGCRPGLTVRMLRCHCIMLGLRPTLYFQLQRHPPIVSILLCGGRLDLH